MNIIKDTEIFKESLTMRIGKLRRNSGEIKADW